VHIVFQAWTLDFLQIQAATSKGKNLPQEIDHGVDGAGVGERPEVAALAFNIAAGDLKFRPIARGDPQVGQAFVILEADVVIRPVALDEV
jgi:hypothetical protein